MKVVVVIPTYNEKENVTRMVDAVLGLPIANPNTQTPNHSNIAPLELLVVDDSSPDGTGAIVEELMKSEPRLHCLHREKKEGLGRAYVAGFKKAMELGADLVIQMDCDFSHDPNDIPRLIDAITTPHESKHQNTSNTQTTDLVIGSRYVKGGGTPGWPFKRRLVSRCGGLFIRTVTGMPIKDPTGGFRCWRRETLEALDLDTVESAGYSFQLEMNHRAWKRGFAIKEIPIVFTDRVAGCSKITPGIAVESIRIALRLRFRS